jgi:hypothetical protein
VATIEASQIYREIACLGTNNHVIDSGMSGLFGAGDVSGWDGSNGLVGDVCGGTGPDSTPVAMQGGGPTYNCGGRDSSHGGLADEVRRGGGPALPSRSCRTEAWSAAGPYLAVAGWHEPDRRGFGRRRPMRHEVRCSSPSSLG